MTRDRVAAQPVQGQRQSDHQDRQRHRRGDAAQDRSRAPPAGPAAHRPGPVTPATSEAVAEPVDDIESIPMIDSTRVGAVTVTVTWIDSVPAGLSGAVVARGGQVLPRRGQGLALVHGE